MSSVKLKIISPEILLENVEYFSELINSLKIVSIFQTPRWGLVMHESFGYDPYLLLLSDEKGLHASLLFLMDRFTGRVQSIDGPCLDSPDTSLTDILIRTYKRIAYRLGAERVEFRLLPGLETSERVQIFSFRAVKHIDKRSDDIWKRLDKKSVRYSVKKAIRSGVKVYEAKTIKDYLDHVRLSYRSKIRGGMSLYDPEVKNFYKVISSIALHLKNNHKLFLAYLNGKVVATVLYLYNGNLAYYYDVGSDERYHKSAAPDYLMWYSIERLQALKIRTIDLMGLDPSSARSHFKRKFSDEILPNRGFIVSSPKFYIYTLKHYPYAIINFKHIFHSMLRHQLLRFANENKC